MIAVIEAALAAIGLFFLITAVVYIVIAVITVIRWK